MKNPGRPDSFWKHLHPASLTAEMIRFTHTFCLGGLTFLLFLLPAGG
mgnify:CR=1 FL=1